jgi:hypothetical protein
MRGLLPLVPCLLAGACSTTDGHSWFAAHFEPKV